jgi:hypothetical protein
MIRPAHQMLGNTRFMVLTFYNWLSKMLERIAWRASTSVLTTARRSLLFRIGKFSPTLPVFKAADYAC